MAPSGLILAFVPKKLRFLPTVASSTTFLTDSTAAQRKDCQLNVTYLLLTAGLTLEDAILQASQPLLQIRMLTQPPVRQESRLELGRATKMINICIRSCCARSAAEQLVYVTRRACECVQNYTCVRPRSLYYFWGVVIPEDSLVKRQVHARRDLALHPK